MRELVRKGSALCGRDKRMCNSRIVESYGKHSSLRCVIIGLKS